MRLRFFPGETNTKIITIRNQSSQVKCKMDVSMLTTGLGFFFLFGSFSHSISLARSAVVLSSGCSHYKSVNKIS